MVIVANLFTVNNQLPSNQITCTKSQMHKYTIQVKVSILFTNIGKQIQDSLVV